MTHCCIQASHRLLKIVVVKKYQFSAYRLAKYSSIMYLMLFWKAKSRES